MVAQARITEASRSLTPNTDTGLESHRQGGIEDGRRDRRFRGPIKGVAERKGLSPWQHRGSTYSKDLADAVGHCPPRLSLAFRLLLMPRQSTTYDILIASPSDTTAERDVISRCIRDWSSAHAQIGIHCRDVRWELDAVPAYGERTQDELNMQLVDSSDILIGVFKARIGTPTGISSSGTIEEIDRFVASGKPVMLYFCSGPIPSDHDEEQWRLLKTYKSQISGKAFYRLFKDGDDLRQQISHNLAALMVQITNSPSAPSAQNDLAKIFIRTRPGQPSGDVRTVKVSAVIENISAKRKITDYVCTVSVPRACLTHASGIILGEIRQEPPSNRRVFRVSSSDPGRVAIILQGDKVPLFALDLGVDQLKMTGTYLAGDYEGTVAENVTVDAVVEGELLHAERTVAEIFENPQQG